MKNTETDSTKSSGLRLNNVTKTGLYYYFRGVSKVSSREFHIKVRSYLWLLTKWGSLYKTAAALCSFLSPKIQSYKFLGTILMIPFSS